MNAEIMSATSLVLSIIYRVADYFSPDLEIEERRQVYSTQDHQDHDISKTEIRSTGEMHDVSQIKKKPYTAICVIDGAIMSDDIQKQFIEYFEKINLQQKKIDCLPQKFFEEFFQCCRSEFTDKLKESLLELTQLNEYENASSRIDPRRHRNLSEVFKAYKLLLKYSTTKLRTIDQSIIDQVKTSISDDVLAFQLSDQIVQAVTICWKMQLLCNPMFICQPKVFNENWHEFSYDSSYDKPNYELVYYRPVLINCAGGSRACKGLVEKRKKSTTSNNVELKDSSETYEPLESNLNFVSRNDTKRLHKALKKNKKKLKIAGTFTKKKWNLRRSTQCTQRYKILPLKRRIKLHRTSNNAISSNWRKVLSKLDNDQLLYFIVIYIKIKGMLSSNANSRILQSIHKMLVRTEEICEMDV